MFLFLQDTNQYRKFPNSVTVVNAMNKKPKILIVNDDGVHAPGIKHLWRAISSFAETTIIAPDTEKSGTGMGITIYSPLHIEPVAWEKDTPAWKVSGTPADCVRLGTSVILDHKPDLIVSGINKGANSGRTALFSGTVGGVIEGVLRDIPGIAFSCVSFENPNYAMTEKYVRQIVQHLLEHPLSHGTLLNVNFPEVDSFKGLKLARQGRGYWKESPDERRHPDGYTYYWLGGEWHHHEEDEQSDVSLLSQGYITAVPIHVNELTDHSFLSSRKQLFEELFSS